MQGRDILKGGNIGVRAGGRGVLGVYYLLENIIHYYYSQSEGGEDSPPSLPLENTLGNNGYLMLMLIPSLMSD